MGFVLDVDLIVWDQAFASSIPDENTGDLLVLYLISSDVVKREVCEFSSLRERPRFEEL